MLNTRIACAVDPWTGIQFSMSQVTEFFDLVDQHLLNEALYGEKKPFLLNWNQQKDPKDIYVHYDSTGTNALEQAFGTLTCFVPESDIKGKSHYGSKSAVNRCKTHPCRIAQILAKIVCFKNY